MTSGAHVVRVSRYPGISPLMQPVPGTLHLISPLTSQRGAAAAPVDTHTNGLYTAAASALQAPTSAALGGSDHSGPLRGRADSDVEAGSGGGPGQRSLGGSAVHTTAPSDDDSSGWHDVGPPRGRPHDLEPFLPWRGGGPGGVS